MRHVLSAAALLSLGCSLPALAAPMVQPTHAVYGCVDPRATTALAIPDGRLRNRKWVEYVHRTGHCSLLAAGQPLEVLARQGVLALLKSPDASADTPPVYAQFSDMTEAAAASQAADQASAADPATAAASVATQPLAAQTAVPPAAGPSVNPSAAAPSAAAPSAAIDGTAQSAPAATTPQTVPAVPDQAPSASVAPVAPDAQTTAAPAPVVVPPAVPAPAQAVPAQTTSAQTTPAETTPAQTAPAQTAPVQTAPVQAVPVQAPPVQTQAATPAPAPVPLPDAAAPAGVSPGVPVPVAAHSSGVSLLLVLVLLALLGLVGAAVAIARQQRRFAHVEDANWPPRDERGDPLASPMPVSPAVQPEPSPQSFRKSCVEVLEQGGWIIQPSFAAGASREGAPDILGRRRDAVLAVRCRGGNATITPEIVDEVAAMGQQAHAHVIVLATAAPMTRRAHDEAMRLHVHVLAQDELGSLSA